MISDNGPGVAESLPENILQPFFTTKEVGKGTGIVLSISRQIVVEKHGGIFIYHQRQPHGSQFVIQIPLAAA